LTSSVKKKQFEFLTTLRSTFMNIIKRIGHRTVPSGTPDNTSYGIESAPWWRHGIICWSANYGTKQIKQELVRHQADEKAVNVELDQKVAKIEINGINLALGMNQKSKEVKVNKTIFDCRFIFGESMLTGIKFGLQMV
jgi:phospholipase/lecithinase/hemolysin